jgi:catechol 2,3-dioxygenase-like lactoylglutathione lyase family enzyme
MSLHGLLSVTIGVPNLEETAEYYTDFGLAPAAGGWFSTADGGPQLRIVHAPTRRLVELHVAGDDPDDLGRAATNLARLGLAGQLSGAGLATIEPVTGTRVYLDVARRLHQDPPTATDYNGPGRFDRTNNRALGFMRPDRVRPRKLGHVVLGSVDYRATMAFFVDGLGFKVSDRIKDVGAFMRCSTDHHNILVLSAPVNFLHHKDPAGNFSEYYSDMDCIVDDQLWTPEDLEGARGLFAWGPPPPPSFLHPEDLAALMTSSHAST